MACRVSKLARAVVGALQHTPVKSERDLVSLLLEQAQGFQVLAREWYVRPGRSDMGVGDLVLRCPCGVHVVVEAKRTGTGEHAEARRAHVHAQALKYGRAWHARRKVSATLTEAEGLVVVAVSRPVGGPCFPTG